MFQNIAFNSSNLKKQPLFRGGTFSPSHDENQMLALSKSFYVQFNYESFAVF